MKRMTVFAPYPLAREPRYLRWFAGAVGLLVLLGIGSALQPALVAPRLFAFTVGGMLLGGLLAFLFHVLYFRFNRHNAQCYGEAVEREQQAWWAQHRQHAALVESVLLSASCSSPEDLDGLLDSYRHPPMARETGEGLALRMLQVFGRDAKQREQELATLLALKWGVQRGTDQSLTPSSCYWHGSQAAWRAFVEQMAQCRPDVHLPEHPQAWDGIHSLDAIIDQLHRAPDGARVLCAGCQSSPPHRASSLPAGEAAVLWLLGTEGDVAFSRGEWFSQADDDLATVAQRAVEQSLLDAPAHLCMSFSQPDVPGLATIGWNAKTNIQDASFGALNSLEALVVQTLAAWYVKQHGVPCSWLASDPHFTLTLGIARPHESGS
ncbi:hypothetical protein JET66_21665 [Pseudomonas putida]|nr:hypothetical protein [Pseudomonas putida]